MRFLSIIFYNLKQNNIKKVLLKGLFFSLLIASIVGCKKDDMLVSKSDDYIKSESGTLINDEDSIVSRAYVVYATMSCQLENGKAGTQCAITQTDDDCSEQTACKAEVELENYSKALHSMFNPEEIDERAKRGVRITEPELIEALKKDGFPLK